MPRVPSTGATPALTCGLPGWLVPYRGGERVSKGWYGVWVHMGVGSGHGSLLGPRFGMGPGTGLYWLPGSDYGSIALNSPN